jgi:cytochrome P450
MLTHHEVQRKAQKEIDAIVGFDQLPSFSDWEQLPYLSSVLKEVLR